MKTNNKNRKDQTTIHFYYWKKQIFSPICFGESVQKSMKDAFCLTIPRYVIIKCLTYKVAVSFAVKMSSRNKIWDLLYWNSNPGGDKGKTWIIFENIFILLNLFPFVYVGNKTWPFSEWKVSYFWQQNDIWKFFKYSGRCFTWSLLMLLFGLWDQLGKGPFRLYKVM